MNRYIKYLLWGGVATTLVIVTMTALSDDFESEHTIKPGDVISADVINETFAKIKQTIKTPTVSDLHGVWRGTAYARNGCPATGDWLNCTNGNVLIYLPNIELTFDKGGGTNNEPPTVTCSNNPFVPSSTGSVAAFFDIQAGTFIQTGSGNSVWLIDKPSDTRIRLASLGGDYANYSILFVLDKKNLPPAKPTNLLINRNGMDVVLSWTDNSNDELAFRVLRKDHFTDIYTNVYTTTTNNITSYTNTVEASGIYWYRVSATNAFGESVGSNVKKVIVP